MDIKGKKQTSIDIPEPDKLKIGIVQALWNEKITGEMAEECKKALIKMGVPEDRIIHKTVSGSFELPLGAQMVENSHHPDALICLGCVIKGETDHDIFINQGVTNALMGLNLRYMKPFVFGVLTVNNEEQAVQRSNGQKGNKGKEAAETALEMLTLKQQLKAETKHSIGFRSPIK